MKSSPTSKASNWLNMQPSRFCFYPCRARTIIKSSMILPRRGWSTIFWKRLDPFQRSDHTDTNDRTAQKIGGETSVPTQHGIRVSQSSKQGLFEPCRQREGRRRCRNVRTACITRLRNSKNLMRNPSFCNHASPASIASPLFTQCSACS